MQEEAIKIDYSAYKTADNVKKFKFGEVMKLEINDDHYYYIFNEKNKTGTFMAGVTSVLGEAAPVEFGLREYWKMNTKEAGEEFFNATGERGSKLHAAVDDLINDIELNLKEDYQTAYEKKALLAWHRWFRIFKPTDIWSEFIVASEKYMIAGTVDIKCMATAINAALALNPDRYLSIDPITGEITQKISKRHKTTVLQADVKEGKIANPQKQERWIIDNKFASGIRYSHKKQIQAYYELDRESFGDETAADRIGIILPTAKNKWGFKFVEVEKNFTPFLHIYETYKDLHDGVLPQPDLEQVFPDKLRLFEQKKKKAKAAKVEVTDENS